MSRTSTAAAAAAAAGGSGRSAAEALSASATMVLPGMVGWRVKVKFAGQSEYFPGITTHFADGKMYVLFDDGEKYTASTDEGDKIKFRSQMTAGKLLQLAHARELPSFQRGAFGERLAKIFKSRKVDRKMPLSAALKACNVGLFVPDDADEDDAISSSSHAHPSTLQGDEDSELSASDDGNIDEDGSDDDEDEDDENEDDTDEDDSEDQDEEDSDDRSSGESESSDDDTSSTSDDGSTQSSTSDSLSSASSAAVSSSSSGSDEESGHEQTINVKWCNEATKVVRACVVPVTVTYADWIKLAETYSGIAAAEAVTK